MLQTLLIENIAIIQRLEIDFTEGFHAITGETGTGKSILIDSIGLLVGAKTDKTLIRTGENVAYVSGLFSGFSSSQKEKLSLMDIELDGNDSLLVERYIYQDGKTKIRLNGGLSTVSKLKDISKYLIDIHGQTDTYTLYDATNYIHVLDGFSKNRGLLEEYKGVYEQYAAFNAQIEEMSKSESERLRLVEMLTYQIEDIETVSPKIGEDDALEEKELRIKNSEKIYKQASFVYRAIKGGDKGNALMLLDRSIQSLEQLSQIIPDVGHLTEELRDCRYRIEDVADQSLEYASQEGGDPTQQLNRIEARLDAIVKLKKKYGDTVEDILSYLQDAKKRLALLENADDRLIELKEKRDSTFEKALKIADKLHENRQNASKTLPKEVIANLVFLDMPKVDFRVTVTPKEQGGKPVLNALGYDEVDFLVSANQGEELHSLSKVASGGELARMMLALKCVEKAGSGTGAMVFDEIDSGVSGKTARKIGLKLLELSQGTQIFCVTHSAQIASLADTHFLISKHTDGLRTYTTILPLDEDGRIQELSRVLGGIHVTDAQRQAAIDMRKEKEQFT